MTTTLWTKRHFHSIILIAYIFLSFVTRASAQTAIIDNDHAAYLMKSFSCHREQKNIQLDWISESEPDSSWFVVERSEDRHEFVTIGRVNARHGIENGAYRFSDQHSDANAHYFYRLRQVNVHGITKFSQAISVDNTDPFAQMQVFSDLTSVRVNYSLTSPAADQVTVQVCTATGVVLFEQNDALIAGRNQLSIALTGIRDGQYVLKILDKKNRPEHEESFVKL